MQINALDPLIEECKKLLATGNLSAAEALLRPHLATGSGPIPLWRLLVRAIRPQGKIGETRVIQEMLVDHQPADLATRFDLSETLLLLGEFDRGWLEYRYRYSLQHTKSIERKVQLPRWNGNPIPNQTLYIHDEQGYGDTFQFLRLVKLAKDKSQAKIILEVNQESFPLVARSLSGVVDQFVVKGALPPPFDLHCELMSLPYALKLQLSDLPGQVPYLFPDSSRVTHWRAFLERFPKPWVAICWAGRPTHFNDANRSLTLSSLSSILECDATFLSIQKGPATQQMSAFSAKSNLLNLDYEIRDFEDTAAILSLCNLLISVDSSPVHLAGAVGCPAWVMLPFVPDWRWLINRSDTPWYPKHRLYRQASIGDWGSVINAIQNDLSSAITEINRQLSS